MPNRPTDISSEQPLPWFAVKSFQDLLAEEYFIAENIEVFYPKRRIRTANHRQRFKPLISRVLFVRTSRENILRLERESRKDFSPVPPLWIYRYPKDNEVQEIPQQSIELLRLIAADPSGECRIFTAEDFKEKQKVKITDGIFKGYEGVVQRIKKNRHVVVRIEGICMVVLPFIDPAYLEPVS